MTNVCHCMMGSAEMMMMISVISSLLPLILIFSRVTLDLYLNPE